MSLEQVELLRLIAKANYYRQVYSKSGCNKSLYQAQQYENRAESIHLMIENRDRSRSSACLYVNR